MDAWLMYLGEVVWRISRAPRVLGENTRDERFCFRSYGVLTAIVFMAFVVLIVVTSGDQLLAMVRELDKAMGAEKVVFQTVFYAVLTLIVGLPLLVTSLVVVAAVVGTTVSFFRLILVLLGHLLKLKRKRESQRRPTKPIRRRRVSRRWRSSRGHYS